MTAARALYPFDLQRLAVVVPFELPRERIPALARVRTTLLGASLLSVRQMGWEDRYFATLPAAFHNPIRTMTTGAWVPIELAMAHYTACDRMGMTAADITRMGEEVLQRTQKTFIAVVARATAEVGVTPWLFWSNIQRVWDRIFDGGGIAIYRDGPKEAYVEIIHCPLLTLPYMRAGFRSYYRAVVGLFAKVVYVSEAPQFAVSSSFVFRFSWV